ncbi:unnamed protein product [Jaminaea pallidilutea]
MPGRVWIRGSQLQRSQRDISLASPAAKAQARSSEGGPKEETGELHLFETESVSPPAYLPADGCSRQAKSKIRGCGGRGREQGVGGSGHAGCCDSRHDAAKFNPP